MQTERRTISPLRYYLLTAGLTNLVFVVVGIPIFLLLSSPAAPDPILIGIILYILVQKSLIVGYVTYSFHKQGRFDLVSGTQFVGFYFGRLYGLLIGAFVGSRLAGALGALVGAVGLYFAGRWAGLKVGFAIGRLLDRSLPVAALSGQARPGSALPLRSLATVYAVIFPFLMLLLGLFFQLDHIQPASSPAGTLRLARIIAIVLSLFSLGAPWRLRSRISQKDDAKRASSLFWPGLVSSVAPAVYGFVVFLLGASILELAGFAVVSSLAALIWSRSTNAEEQEPG